VGYNEADLRAMLAWIDGGTVRELSLVASIFFRSHKGELWQRTLTEFRSRKQRAACCHCPAKLVALAFATITAGAATSQVGPGRFRVAKKQWPPR
jgi:hypothetical protein